MRSFLSRHGIDIPHEKTFVTHVIPKVLEKVNNLIELKLKKAVYITVIVDLWDSAQMKDYGAVAVEIIFEDFSKKVFVIGIERMEGAHTAEGVRDLIQKIINQYNFDKSKIVAVVCDEGSNLVRLFLQMIEQNLESFKSEINWDWDGLPFSQFDFFEDMLEYDVDEDNNPIIDKNASIDKVDDEINDIVIEDIVPLETALKARMSLELVSEDNYEDNDANENDANDNDHYNLDGLNQLISTLELEIGSNKIKRFSCANHKFNIAFRNTVKSDKRLQKIIALLSKCSKSSHKSYKIAKVFQEKKNRLRGENKIRWSAIFLMLQCFHKAYKKGCFEQSKCPVSLADIDFYLELLLPCYRFTLLNQRKRSHIGDLIPALTILKKQYQYFAKADPKKKIFSENLISNIDKKFEYELNSGVYAVAAILNTPKLSQWYQYKSSSSIIERALLSMPQVTEDFKKENKSSQTA